MFRLIYFCVLLCLRRGETIADTPAGHLQPLGSHQSQFPSITELSTFPNPLDFFDNYVQQSKPVIFRGVAKQFPSYNNLKNDTYLKGKYGNMTVQVEIGKKETRNDEMRRVTLKQFIEIYQTKDIYQVNIIQKPNKFTDEVSIPKPLLCHFVDYIDLVILWFSSGGTKSVIHYDSYENFNCLYDGTKRFLFAEEKHREILDNVERGYSRVDVDAVDMIKYPTMANIEWKELLMEAGDCLYIPAGWIHQVESSRPRNLAINVWFFSTLSMPTRDKCQLQTDSLPQFDVWSNYDLCPRPNTLRFVNIFKGIQQPITLEVFIRQVLVWIDYIADSEIEAMFRKIDTDNDGNVTYDDMYRAPVSLYETFFDPRRNEEMVENNEQKLPPDGDRDVANHEKTEL